MRRKQFTPEKSSGCCGKQKSSWPKASASARSAAALGISEQSYYRWRSEYGGLKLAQARRMKDLEKENGRLKKAVAEQTLDKSRVFAQICQQPLRKTSASLIETNNAVERRPAPLKPHSFERRS